MQKNYSQLFIGIIIGLLAGILIVKMLLPKNNIVSANTQVSSNKNTENNLHQNNYPQNNNNRNNHSNNNNSAVTGANYNGNVPIPEKVLEIVKYIKENNRAMNGYVGGRVFTNREQVLPMTDISGATIQYQEWDVNPKIEGQNRGTERICTGSDGRSWYTNDHYRTFTQIK